MGDEDDKKKSQQHVDAVRTYWDRQNSMTEAEKVADKALREGRIEQIAEIMRECYGADGKTLWTRKLRLQLGREWGLTDQQTQKLSGEAHKRVTSEVDNPEELRRTVGIAVMDGLALAFRKKDWKAVAALGALGIKMADRVQKIEVTIETKQPTPADAARAVAEMFGTKVSNFDECEKESPGGTEPAGDPSEE